MHISLTNLKAELSSTIEHLKAKIPTDEPFNIAHGNWTFPGLTRSDLIAEVEDIINLIDENETDVLDETEPTIVDFLRRLQFLQTQTLANLWANAAAGAPAFLLTLQGIRRIISSLKPVDNRAQVLVDLRKATTQVRSLEAKISGLQPRTASLVSMVGRIEQAYEAADQLPTDLASLSEARSQIAGLVHEAEQDQLKLTSLHEEATQIDKTLKKRLSEAEAVLERCETAYSAATSVGLAAAFTERSNSLASSMWVWVFGLVCALLAGSFFGSTQLHNLSELLKVPDASPSIVLLNLLLSLLSVAAPVWFAWLSTKQIGQRFRLAEDYAFKASISRAYEGFRREAARFDKDMEARLLGSALSRLDELPLRLVEPDTHGSPWHELASSDTVKQALAAIPGFADQVRDLASKAITKTTTAAAATTSVIKPASVSAANSAEAPTTPAQN
ncbi:hypothetical protein [Pseudomonas monteilii]|uniref:hypothetical protein n=1 Tax=Pseudomonas monteilii TaxID=76759 RepID=UPI001FD5436D|nr:hypothetical protein [Pseudomonas monteilii]MCJ7852418.1 hypothetical protein [Pseudomonas monteilii]